MQNFYLNTYTMVWIVKICYHLFISSSQRTLLTNISYILYILKTPENPAFPIYTPWKYQKTEGFLFLGGIKREQRIFLTFSGVQKWSIGLKWVNYERPKLMMLNSTDPSPCKSSALEKPNTNFQILIKPSETWKSVAQKKGRWTGF